VVPCGKQNEEKKKKLCVLGGKRDRKKERERVREGRENTANKK
jgi:hypothetical protein